MPSRSLRKYLGLSASALLLAGNSAWAAQTLEYSIRWDIKDDRYHVFMRPTTTPSPDMSMTAQVTVRAPHADGADKFLVDYPQSNITNTIWNNDSRVDAPVENPNSDYISFTLTTLKPAAFAWKAGTEVEVFNFRNTGKCLGPVELMNNNTDPFNQPILQGKQNSAGTNPGNHFTNLGWGERNENNYLGNYGDNSASCTDSLDTDGDGLKDGVEKQLGTDPTKPDTDGDGLKDGDEITTTKTDPLKPDTDGDGLKDGDEVHTYKTDPTVVDTDKDGLGDGVEVLQTKTNPLSTDSDADGIDDKTEVGPNLSAPIDTDGDSIPNALDVDDDNDSILTKYENYNGGSPVDDDTDADSKPDYLDADDDGDGKLTKNENPDPNGDGNPVDALDTDGDGKPDYLDKIDTDGPKGDTDGDGIINTDEPKYGTDPNNPDTDNDGLKDGDEVAKGTDPLKPDTDGDGLKDGDEVAKGTDPLKPDTDGDGLKDGDEVTKGTDPLKPDTDGDGLKDGEEITKGTDPLKPDTDGDGLNDNDEIKLGLNPLSTDTDNDSVDDKTEVGPNISAPLDHDGDGKIDPLDTDDDNDGILTKYENYNGGSSADDDTDADGIPDYLDTDDDGDGKLTKNENPDPNGDGNPVDAVDTDKDGKPDYLDKIDTDGPKGDADGDGLTNGEEATLGTNPNNPDTDNDGLTDGVEVNNTKTDPLKPDTDGDGLTDGSEVNTTKTDPLKPDTDGDGLPDGTEINTTKTDPLKPDSDGDGLPDGTEVHTTKTDPLKPDTDGDGLPDGTEVNTTKTDPLKPDTDGDGLSDGTEVNTTKTDPLKVDTDGDKINDDVEVGKDVAHPIDSDNDGLINAVDPDDDNDSIPTKYEDVNNDGNPLNDDTDNDGIPNYLDVDDDGDGIATKNEVGTLGPDGNPANAQDLDVDGIPDYLDPVMNALRLQVRALLQGAYNGTAKTMSDELRVKGLLPSSQPYNIGQIKYAGKEVANSSLFAVTGANAPVDWLLVELRSATSPTTIKAQQAVLLQRDGDVMDAITGDTQLVFGGVPSGNYYVSVRHRNHLGVMTAQTVSLSPAPVAMVDFTKSSTTTFGQEARLLNADGTALLWAGNANTDNRAIANGPSNDTGFILSDVLLAKDNTSVSTNFRLNGYQTTDINMDGITIFAGPANDVNLLLGNILLHPGNSTFSANYIINQQLP